MTSCILQTAKGRQHGGGGKAGTACKFAPRSRLQCSACSVIGASGPQATQPLINPGERPALHYPATAKQLVSSACLRTLTYQVGHIGGCGHAEQVGLATPGRLRLPLLHQRQSWAAAWQTVLAGGTAAAAATGARDSSVRAVALAESSSGNHHRALTQPVGLAGNSSTEQAANNSTEPRTASSAASPARSVVLPLRSATPGYSQSMSSLRQGGGSEHGH